jgi:hypothetical protein
MCQDDGLYSWTAIRQSVNQPQEQQGFPYKEQNKILPPKITRNIYIKYQMVSDLLYLVCLHSERDGTGEKGVCSMPL